MKKLLFMIVFICAAISLAAQVNFVKNPSLEIYDTCPSNFDQITYARHWSCAIDTIGTPLTALEYFNSCDASPSCGIPSNVDFYQYAHSGQGVAGAIFFNDESRTYPGVPNGHRNYLQGRLYRVLDLGKNYCVKFWVNVAERSAYVNNKIGAYLDNGSINRHGEPPGSPLTFVVPQVYTDSVLADTASWMLIEGSFTANGTERIITIGNFNTIATTTYKDLPGSWNPSPFGTWSYYLIDDISVIPLDLPAVAGPDTWVRTGDSVQVGRVGDTTTLGLDCKWYHKGNLIDSGAAIWAKGYGMVGDKDTYTVVQTICGLVKTDTVVVYTASVGIKEIPKDQQFNIFPNPSDGAVTITAAATHNSPVQAKVYDISGRLLLSERLLLKEQAASLYIDAASGLYLLELAADAGNKQRQLLEIRH